jgi:hypothetical protein
MIPPTGRRDSTFYVRVLYRDIDSEPPEYIKLYTARKGDGIPGNQAGELFYMRADTSAGSSSDYSAGVYYHTSFTNVARQSSMPYMFRASDSHVITPLGIPPFSGSRVIQTVSVGVSDTEWFPDTIINQDFLISPSFRFINTGDGLQTVDIRITRADLYPYTGNGREASGGLTFAMTESGVSGNKYCLSAIFYPDTIRPYEADSGADGSNDVITDVSGMPSAWRVCVAGFHVRMPMEPSDTMNMILRLDSPKWTIGPYKLNDHRITVRLTFRAYMP